MVVTHREHLLLLDGLPVLAPLAGLLHLVTPRVRLNNKRSGHGILTIVSHTWSASILDLVFSAFFLWMCSIRTRLFLKVLPLAFRYSSWYR